MTARRVPSDAPLARHRYWQSKSGEESSQDATTGDIDVAGEDRRMPSARDWQRPEAHPGRPDGGRTRKRQRCASPTLSLTRGVGGRLVAQMAAGGGKQMGSLQTRARPWQEVEERLEEGNVARSTGVGYGGGRGRMPKRV